MRASTFVFVNGVLIHLENMGEIVHRFRKAARITKKKLAMTIS